MNESHGIDLNDVLDRVEYCRYRLLKSNELGGFSGRKEILGIWSSASLQVPRMVRACDMANSDGNLRRALMEIAPLATLLDTTPRWLLLEEGPSPFWWGLDTKAQKAQWQLHRRIMSLLLYRGVHELADVVAITGEPEEAVKSVIYKGRGPTSRIVKKLAEAFDVDPRWLQYGSSDSAVDSEPAWRGGVVRWLQQAERDRGLGKTAQGYSGKPSTNLGSIRQAWNALITRHTAPYDLGKLPKIQIERVDLVRQDVTEIFTVKQLIKLGRCLRVKLPREDILSNEVSTFQRHLDSQKGFTANLLKLAGCSVKMDEEHLLAQPPSHPPAEVIQRCLTRLIDKTKRPRAARNHLLAIREILAGQGPDLGGLFEGLSVAVEQESPGIPGGAIGLVFKALLAGTQEGTVEEMAEAIETCDWLLRSPIKGEPSWPLEDLVGLHRTLRMAQHLWFSQSIWTAIPGEDRCQAVWRSKAGKVISGETLVNEYRLRELPPSCLLVDLEALARSGQVFPLPGGFWRFSDRCFPSLKE